jgi:putative addiction module CopG family antidote
MKIELSQELARFVRNKIERGECESVSDVICEALTLLALRDRVRRERVAQLWDEIEEGVRQASRGGTVPAESVFVECRRLVASYQEAKR